MMERFDDEVWAGIERHLAGVEPMIPATPPFEPDRVPTADERIHVLPGLAFSGPASTRRTALLLLVAALAIALVIGALLVGSRPRPTSSWRNGAIAYVDLAAPSNGGGVMHLVEPDGTNDHIVGPVGTPALCPTFSPDGRQVAYWAGSFDTVDLFTAQADGNGARQILGTSTLLDYAPPAWSPDGTRIAAIHSLVDSTGVATVNELQVVTLLGASPRSILTEQLQFHDPSWSPDGSTIAVILGDYEAAAIILLEPDGSRLRRLAAPGATAVAWSPDGAHLAYNRWPEGFVLTPSDTVFPSTAIFVSDADGSGATDVTGVGAGSHSNPAWSPDGSLIAFWRFDPSAVAGELETMHIDGSDVRAIRTDLRSVGHAVWSPDGERLILVADPPGEITPGGFAALVSLPEFGPGQLKILAGSGRVENFCAPSWQRLPP